GFCRRAAGCTDIDIQVFCFWHGAALRSSRQVYGLDADHAGHIPEAHHTADHDARIDPADKAEFEHAVLGDLFDNHTDLIHVHAYHDRALKRSFAFAEYHHIADGIGPDLVRKGLCLFEYKFTHRVLTARGAGQGTQRFEQLS